MTEILALDQRVTRMENQIASGFDRIERLLRSEIDDLKKEQINDLREALRRLADDQRRAWEAIEMLRRREDQKIGSSRTLENLWRAMSAVIGGILALGGNWLARHF